ncbi:MAG: PAS domain-containing protein [Sphaerospermopsis sp. SIO1G2]|nr:PAS domain-containing protein [Sphaerospermopsis sp. SIO1G2]
MKLSALTQELFRYTRDAVVICEAARCETHGHRIVFVNQAFTDMTGYSLADVLGKSPAILQGPDTDPETKEQMTRQLDAWEEVRCEVFNYKKDGTPFWVDLSIVPVADDTGWYHYWVAVQRDVTALKEQQLALELANSQIKHAARYDALSGLANRAGFEKLLERTQHQFSSSAEPCMM